MSEATPISKMLMLTETGHKSPNKEKTFKHPLTDSPESNAESIQTKADLSKNETTPAQNSEKTADHLFARVWNQTLEKREKPKESKKHSRQNSNSAGPSDPIILEYPLQKNYADKSNGPKLTLTNNGINNGKISQKMVSNRGTKPGLSLPLKVSKQEHPLKIAIPPEKPNSSQPIHGKTDTGIIQQSVRLPEAHGKLDLPVRPKDTPENIHHPQRTVKPMPKAEKPEPSAPVISSQVRSLQSQDKIAIRPDLSFRSAARHVDEIIQPQAVQNEFSTKAKKVITDLTETKYEQAQKSNFIPSKEEKSTSGFKNVVGSDKISSPETPSAQVTQQGSANQQHIPASRAQSDKTIETVHPTSIQSISQASQNLSAAQQILRSIQIDVDNDIRQINLMLSPPGLGMVRIHFQRTGEEISGLLEIQKPETRQEIEKSLPQMFSVLESQGIQIRRIEIASLPNSNQKQSGFEDAGQWTMNREMADQGYGQNRPSNPAGKDPASNPGLDIITHGKQKGYITEPGLKNLNMYA